MGQFGDEKNNYSSRPEGSLISTWFAEPPWLKSGPTKYCFKVPFSKCNYSKAKAEKFLRERIGKSYYIYSLPFNVCWHDALRTFSYLVFMTLWN